MGARAVDWARLESVCTARYRGFESLPIRQFSVISGLPIDSIRGQHAGRAGRFRRLCPVIGSRKIFLGPCLFRIQTPKIRKVVPPASMVVALVWLGLSSGSPFPRKPLQKFFLAQAENPVQRVETISKLLTARATTSLVYGLQTPGSRRGTMALGQKGRVPRSGSNTYHARRQQPPQQADLSRRPC
jgi:hypothetical protein